MEKITINRDKRIDWLRAISIILIVLAHIPGVPSTIFNIRTFDVPLMVFLSGASFQLSYKGEKYLTYVLKRTKRLIIPLIIFYILFSLFNFILNGSFFTLSDIIFNRMPYIWIIKIFFLIALISPLIYKLIHFKESILYKLGLTFLFIIFQKIMFALFISSTNYFANVLLSNIGYVICALVGMILVSLSKKEIVYYISFFVAIFCYKFVTTGFVPMQTQKYPPNLYFISYGLVTSCILLFIFSYIKYDSSIIKWLSINSLNIYYVHTFIIILINPNLHWYIIYVATIIISTSLILFYKIIISKLNLNSQLRWNGG